MNKIIYLEPDDEITGVIDRIRKSEESGVVLVVPRGGTIGQSIINLKLLVRNTENLEKSVGLVTSDKITQNLATQLKIKTFGKVSDAEKASLGKPVTEARKATEEPNSTIIGGLKVNTYKKYSAEELEGEPEPEVAESEEVEAMGEEQPEANEPEDEALSEAVPSMIEDEPSPTHHVPIEPDVPEPEEDLAQEEEVVMQGPRNPKKHVRTEGSRKALLFVGSIIVLIVLIVSFLFIPSATAVVTIKAEDLSKDILITADKSITENNIANQTVPAKLLEVSKDGTKTSNATGQKDVGAKATGKITISNTVTTDSQLITAGTKVVAADGKNFTITTGVTVPGAALTGCQLVGGKLTCDTTPGTVDANVTATENGDQYNLAPTTFTVGKFSAANKAAFAGGVTSILKIVTDDDLAKAQTDLVAELKTGLQTDLEKQVSEQNLRLAADSVKEEIVTVSVDKKSGDQADTFTTTLTIKLMGLAFLESDMRNIVLDSIANGLPTDQMVINPLESEISYNITSVDTDSGIVKVTASFKGKIGAKIDANVVKDRLKSKNVTSAQSYLDAIPGIESAKLSTIPGFWKMTPLLKNRITVKFEYGK